MDAHGFTILDDSRFTAWIASTVNSFPIQKLLDVGNVCNERTFVSDLGLKPENCIHMCKHSRLWIATSSDVCFCPKFGALLQYYDISYDYLSLSNVGVSGCWKKHLKIHCTKLMWRLGLDSFLLPRKDCWITIHADADQVFRHRKCKEMRLSYGIWWYPWDGILNNLIIDPIYTPDIVGIYLVYPLHWRLPWPWQNS